jgi:hypothetical protein
MINWTCLVNEVSYILSKKILDYVKWTLVLVLEQRTVFNGKQGCQMVRFQAKNPNLGKFWRVLQRKILVYFMDTWSILCFLSYLMDICFPFLVFEPRKIWQPWIGKVCELQSRNLNGYVGRFKKVLKDHHVLNTTAIPLTTFFLTTFPLT